MNFEEVTDHDEGNDAIYVALLHEVIMPTEVLDQAKEMKPDKASGPDGLPPGVFSLLPAQWLLTIHHHLV